ncbi:MAG: acyltransferase [Sideroxyarcus sp.]|nr:acyltransferase [Sideroxyarcus sp.]
MIQKIANILIRQFYCMLIAPRKKSFKEIGAQVHFGNFFSCMNPQFVSIGNNVTLGAHSIIFAVNHDLVSSCTPEIVIGEGTYIGQHTSVHAIEGVHIGNHSVISDFVYISDLAHGFDLNNGPILKQRWEKAGPITIGQGVFIGHGAKILPNVSLGDNCIVGAGSIVTKSFPAYSVIAGNPARLLRNRLDTGLQDSPTGD